VPAAYADDDRAMTPPHVLVVGEALVDIVRYADGSVHKHAGGSPANVAVALARLGHAVDLATSLGDDRLGTVLRRHFADAGVSLVGESSPSVRTSSALASLDETGAASYTFDLVWDLAPFEVDPAPVLVHTGSLGAVLLPGAETVASTLARLRSTATVSYDLNARPAATGVDAALLTRIERLVGLSDVVKASDEDLLALYPDRPVEAAAEHLLALGAGAVVVTWGARGAVCHTAAGVVEAPARRAKVADTIGAGDSFCAALLHGLLEHGLAGADHRAELAALSPDGWLSVLDQANRAAAITVSRPGADPPTRSELTAGEDRAGSGR